MKTRPTNQPLALPKRDDLERYVYDGSPSGITLEQTRNDAVLEMMELLAAGKKSSIAHNSNLDEEKYEPMDFLGSFNKGLPRQSGGGAGEDCLPVHDEFLRFRRSVHTGNFFTGPDVPQLGPNTAAWRVVKDDTDLRGWEAPEAGLALEPHGPDSHSVTMAAAPKLESDQMPFEMAEVYWLSLLRDVPLTEFSENAIGATACGEANTVFDTVADLNAMDYANNGFADLQGEADAIYSRTRQTDASGGLTPANLFRGVTPGDLHGPYLSQFMLLGSPAPADGSEGFEINKIKRGNIAYGAQVISQKLRPHRACLDHMTDHASYLDVQEGAKVGGSLFEPNPRFITTPRDMATYVHYDALYQAYLNACLMLMGFGAPVDPGIAAHNNRRSKLTSDMSNVTDGFALFGGPHILNLVTEVSTRGLKAVRYQKFNVHCRLRPEAVASLVEFNPHGVGASIAGKLSNNLKDRIKAWNRLQNSAANFSMRSALDSAKVSAAGSIDQETLLLPMAFPEGSPMHPSYGAGHATVAGACVTVLKAFFDTDAVFVRDRQPSPDQVRIISRSEYESNTTRYKPIAFVANGTGTAMQEVTISDGKPLTVGDELNKLAANIAIARNMAGVHYYTDYIDSLIMGEEVAIRLLDETMSGFGYYPQELRPSMTLTKFLGGEERIGK